MAPLILNQSARLGERSPVGEVRFLPAEKAAFISTEQDPPPPRSQCFCFGEQERLFFPARHRTCASRSAEPRRYTDCCIKFHTHTKQRVELRLVS